MEDKPVNVPEAIQGHKAESDRLGRLTEFLSNFAPAIGEAVQPGRDAQETCAPAISIARDCAIADAFAAVGRIARESFLFPKKGPPP